MSFSVTHLSQERSAVCRWSTAVCTSAVPLSMQLLQDIPNSRKFGLYKKPYFFPPRPPPCFPLPWSLLPPLWWSLLPPPLWCGLEGGLRGVGAGAR